MANTDNNTRPSKFARFIAVNPNQDISASYSSALGEQTADSFATWNARMNKGQVIAQLHDNTTVVHRDFTVKTPKKTV